ncbi:FAD:protein FMN transferase [Psychroflexus gondwanensis]|uniref:FAD:protein FMN transferase n=1 Tax=Psychroflexus gondwanensis TaxID=251 RepID=UPI0011BDE0F5|nr:FAD:protein FMN transferase [Psychroflexus gondwanensis]TXE20432.1 FAD:protein FMN transferase [Psychroflexus gondwanensis]
MKYLFLVLSLLFLSCDKDTPNAQSLRGSAIGTTYSIKYFSEDYILMGSEIDSILKDINLSMSTYMPESDISRINSGELVVVDQNFQKVFKASKRIYEDTQGYFDPSVGLLVNAYGFGPLGYSEDVTEKQIDSLFQFVGFNHIQLSEDAQVASSLPVFYLDFNAIAKGYTVDVFGEYLHSKGVNNYLVEIGGEVRVKGKNLEKASPWKVGIELPVANNSRELMYGIQLKNESLATSGNYRKFRSDSLSGKKYVHTINPNTGQSQKTDILSASVITTTCADADAYATAFMAMGLEKSVQFIEKQNAIKVIFIYSDSEGNQKTYISPELQSSVEEF